MYGLVLLARCLQWREDKTIDEHYTVDRSGFDYLSILLGSIYGGVGVALGFLIPGIISPVVMKRTASKLLNIRADVDILGMIQL